MAIRALVLHLKYPSRASYFDDWLDAFQASPNFEITPLNILHASALGFIKKNHRAFDCIVLLHSCMGDSMLYVDPLRMILSERSCPLLAFVGNELNMPQIPLSQRIRFLKDIEADHVCTQLLQEAGYFLYEQTGAQVHAVPHALNVQAFSPKKSWEDRTIDVGVRTFQYPYYLGDNDRNRMIMHFESLCHHREMAIDFSHSHRFDRNGWARFLNSLKATISTEAGSWYLEKDDQTVLEIDRYIKSEFQTKDVATQDWVRKLVHRLPYGFKGALKKILDKTNLTYAGKGQELLSFDEMFQRFFKDKPRAPVYGKCISSRHFDAVGTKTVQILLEGRYNDILVPGEHYLSLKSDFSNAGALLDTLKDAKACNTLVNRAHDYVLAHHTYDHRLQQVHQILS